MKKTPVKTNMERQRTLALFFGVMAVAIIGGVAFWMSSSDSPPSTTSNIVSTADPTMVANLTAIPQTAPLTGAAADELRALGAQVAGCGEYSDARRRQMNQHIRWLLFPAETPQQVIMAMEATNRSLIFGMADFTANQWVFNQRPPRSCLRDIGLKLNEMLVAAGQEPLTTYEQASQP